MRVSADRNGDDISNDITSCIMSFPRLVTTDRNHFQTQNQVFSVQPGVEQLRSFSMTQHQLY